MQFKMLARVKTNQHTEAARYFHLSPMGVTARDIQQGATESESQVPRPNVPLCLRHSEGSWLSIIAAHVGDCSCLNFRTPRSAPHFTAHHVSNHDRTTAVDHAAVKRPKTRADLVAGGRTPRLSRTDAVRVWGSPCIRREPREIWVVGCETRERKETTTHAICL